MALLNVANRWQRMTGAAQAAAMMGVSAVLVACGGEKAGDGAADGAPSDSVVTVPAVPGAHIVHAATLAVPAAEPVVKMFAGQAVQPAAATVPLPVTVP